MEYEKDFSRLRKRIREQFNCGNECKKILKEMGVEAEVSHTDLATSKSEQADIYLGSKEIVENLEDGKRTVVALKNILDQNEIRRELEKYF